METKNFLTLEEMGLADYMAKPVTVVDIKPSPYDAAAISNIPVQNTLAVTEKDKYSCMCDELKEKAEEMKPAMTLGTTEIINRIVNKLYDLAQDIKLTMDGY